MVRFEGDRDFRLSPAQLWARLTDARFLVQCIPDVESVKSVEDRQAALVLRPGFSFVRGTLDVDLKIQEVVEPVSANFVLKSKGIGSSADVETSFVLSPTDTGTRVHWTAEVKSLGGLLKLIPTGLVRGSAQKVLDDVWKAVEEKLASETP